MNRLSLATAVVSIIVAVALWLVATWLEGDTRWLLPVSPAAPGPSQVEVRPDSEIEVSVQAADCDQAEATLREKLDGAQYCATDEDCTLFDYGYPIECLTSVAKNEISALRAEYSRYEQSCRYRVYYDCPTGRLQRHAVCRSNRCAVELRSNEGLEEETLDYLGVERRRIE